MIRFHRRKMVHPCPNDIAKKRRGTRTHFSHDQLTALIKTPVKSTAKNVHSAAFFRFGRIALPRLYSIG
jgi:hypothetical protein